MNQVTTMPKHKQTYAEGANDTRCMFIAKFKRDLKVQVLNPGEQAVLKRLILWAQKQSARCNARAGGLGKTKKATK